jgi:hypothetical protein
MGLDLTTFDAALKQHYHPDRVEDMTYRKNPLLALMPKYEEFGGRNLPIPIIYGNPQGRSKTFSNAKSRGAATSTRVTDFILTRAKDYSIATIDNETLEASKGDANAFMQAATTEIDGAINSLTRSLGIGAYRDSSAAIGQVNVEPTEASGSFEITLKNTSDVANFEVDQMLVIWSAKSGGSQRISETGSSSWPIEAVNRNTGTLRLTGDYDSNGTIAADDYIFVEGDRGNGIAGLEAWVPSSDPDSTLFFGVDRSVDVSRLGGLRLDGSGAPLEEVLIEADAMVAREQFYFDHFFMNPKRVGELKKSLGTRVQYVNLQANPRISFTAVMMDGSAGPIKVVADANCPYDRCFGVALEYWKFYSLGKMVRVIDTDGLQMLRQNDSDGVEIRYGFYGNIGCRAPGSAINIQL